MLVIVVYHGCNNGPYGNATGCRDVKFCAWLLYWATNAFAFISGWFGIRFSWHKAIGFLGLGLYASFILLLAAPFVTGARASFQCNSTDFRVSA